MHATPNQARPARRASSFLEAHTVRLGRLQPRVSALGSRVADLPAFNPTATPRLRGRAAVERRKRWLAKHPLCKHCDAEGLIRVGDEVDDIVPLWKGGKNDESNFQTLCHDHHAAKTAREAAERAAMSTGGYIGK